MGQPVGVSFSWSKDELDDHSLYAGNVLRLLTTCCTNARPAQERRGYSL